MPLRNKKQDERDSAQNRCRQRLEKPQVSLRVHPMDEQQARRLSTAVDALLAEWVRQEMGRAQQS